MRNWKILFKDDSRFEIKGSFKDFMKICRKKNKIPYLVVSKPI